MWLIFLLFLGGLLGFFDLQAVRMQVVNDIADIIETRKIMLHGDLGQADHALYKDSLQVSSDIPDLEITGWHASGAEREDYIPSFQQNRQLFIESFSLEVSCAFKRKPRKMRNVLREASLCIACLVLDQEGKSNAKNLLIPLNANEIDKPSMIFDEVAKEQHASFSYEQDPMTSTEIDQELTILHDLADIWHALVALLYKLFQPTVFFKLYISMAVILVVLIIMRIRALLEGLKLGTWLIEAERFFTLTFLSLNCPYLRHFWPDYGVVFFLAVVCLYGALYYLISSSQSIFLIKAKRLLGFVMLICAILLGVKGYLMKFEQTQVLEQKIR